MNQAPHPALLPQGMRDILPPDAQIEAEAIGRLVGTLRAHGYERVNPPLLEFETSLLGGPGAAMALDTFRLMDPISQRMIGLRADMTLQVARIATTRLAREPRPLRLCYSGQVLRVRGGQLRPERQFGQVGGEIIGSDLPEADAEVIALAAEAVQALGIANLSVDLTVPTLVPLILAALGVPEAAARDLRVALDRKDAATLAQVGGPAAPVLGQLMASAGPAEAALACIRRLDLPNGAAEEVDRLAAIAAMVAEARPGLMLTIDPVENRGFEYHTGVSFTLFARGIRGEIGRGGRYLAAPAAAANPAGEPSTGFTLYTDTIIRAVPPPPPPRRLYLPAGTSRDRATALRESGWITLGALSATADPNAEARRLRCTHILEANEPRPV